MGTGCCSCPTSGRQTTRSTPTRRASCRAGGEDAWHPEDALLAPLTGPSGELVGVLSVDAPLDGLLPDRDQREMLGLFADHAAIAIEHARVHAMMRQSREALRYSATHDPLTGWPTAPCCWNGPARWRPCPTRGWPSSCSTSTGSRPSTTRRATRPATRSCRRLAARMRSSVDEHAVVARMGGDEFAIALAGPDAHETVRRAGSPGCASSLTQPVYGVFGTHQLGVSIGVAVAQTPAQLAPLLAAADAAMYRTKQRRAADLPDRRSARGLG